MLTADEVIRSLQGSLRLFRREPEGLDAFDFSVEGYWRSFAAILLAMPALVVALAEARVRNGVFLPDTGLFDDANLVLGEGIIFLSGWILFPLLMIGFVRLMGLGQNYAAYAVAYNWSAAVTAALYAIPKLLYVLGLATPGLATFYAFALAPIVLQYRWFLTRTTLGVSDGLAALLVGADLTIAIAFARLVRAVFG